MIAVSEDPLIGAELDDYRPERVLGKGGMGVVYEAQDLSLGRRVALKVLAPGFLDDTSARARFQREIDHAVAIEHPHVVPVYAAGYARPNFYIAMRCVRGPDLAAVIRAEGRLSERRVLRLLGQIASALHAVHARGMVHRDIKPHNVLLWDAGQEDEHALLTDFGIAKALDDTRSLTGVGPIGTPAYMAPEICLGKPARPASDQYSLGCMAFEMLAGKLPYDSGSALDIRGAHVEREPLALRELAPETSPATCAAIARALSKDPSHRFSDVREMVRSARLADDAFRHAREVERAVEAAEKPEEAIASLQPLGLNEGTISEITGIDKTEVVRLQRRAARQSLMGGRRARPGGRR